MGQTERGQEQTPPACTEIGAEKDVSVVRCFVHQLGHDVDDGFVVPLAASIVAAQYWPLHDHAQSVQLVAAVSVLSAKYYQVLLHLMATMTFNS